jgi:hypothetical protein
VWYRRVRPWGPGCAYEERREDWPRLLEKPRVRTACGASDDDDPVVKTAILYSFVRTEVSVRGSVCCDPCAYI